MKESLQPGDPQFVDLQTIYNRGTTGEFGWNLFKYDAVIPPETWTAAEDILKSGKGILVVANHPTLADGPLLISLLFRNPYFRERKFSVPVAHHQSGVSNLINDITGSDMELINIVTPDTVKKHPEMASQQGKGLISYVNSAIDTLGKGGIVVLFPHAERRPRVGIPQNSDVATELLTRKAEHNNIDYGILPLGISVPGVSPELVNGLNLGRKYLIKSGEVITGKALRDRCKSDKTTADHIIYSVFSQLVPPEYR
jgi:hypothetical protein